MPQLEEEENYGGLKKWFTGGFGEGCEDWRVGIHCLVLWHCVGDLGSYKEVVLASLR